MPRACRPMKTVVGNSKQVITLGLAQIQRRGSKGVEAPQITVEVRLAGGLPKVQIVGTN